MNTKPTVPSSTAIEFEGEELEARVGEAVLMALLRHNQWELRRSADGSSRGPFCNMGTCFDCLVVVDGGAPARACLTQVKSGMGVITRASV